MTTTPSTLRLPRSPTYLLTYILTYLLTYLGDYYTFDAAAPTIPYIEAVGTTSSFAYHGKLPGGGTLMLVEVGYLLTY